MDISEEQLKKIILRVLQELVLEGNVSMKEGLRQKVYMPCGSSWNKKYSEILGVLDQSANYCLYLVVPSSWNEKEHETVLKSYSCYGGILYQSEERPSDLAEAITIFPVVSRDIVVKTALCMSDCFETSWIADCIEKGSRIIFLRSGLKKFSGLESPAYRNRIMEYYRMVLEYGIEISDLEEFLIKKPI